MAKCDGCGNDYNNMMRIEYGGQTLVFDSFECAIHKMAPKCDSCDMRIIGHGLAADDQVYCCAHCARQAGHEDLVDKVRSRRTPSSQQESHA